MGKFIFMNIKFDMINLWIEFVRAYAHVILTISAEATSTLLTTQLTMVTTFQQGYILFQYGYIPIITIIIIGVEFHLGKHLTTKPSVYPSIRVHMGDFLIQSVSYMNIFFYLYQEFISFTSPNNKITYTNLS